MIKRIFMIVLDRFGIGETPDANRFGDRGTNTYESVSKSTFSSAIGVTTAVVMGVSLDTKGESFKTLIF